jgi:hypothetical protein
LVVSLKPKAKRILGIYSWVSIVCSNRILFVCLQFHSLVEQSFVLSFLILTFSNIAVLHELSRAWVSCHETSSLSRGILHLAATLASLVWVKWRRLLLRLWLFWVFDVVIYQFISPLVFSLWRLGASSFTQTRSCYLVRLLLNLIQITSWLRILQIVAWLTIIHCFWVLSSISSLSLVLLSKYGFEEASLLITFVFNVSKVNSKIKSFDYCWLDHHAWMYQLGTLFGLYLALNFRSQCSLHLFYFLCFCKS